MLCYTSRACQQYLQCGGLCVVACQYSQALCGCHEARNLVEKGSVFLVWSGTFVDATDFVSVLLCTDAASLLS